MTRGVLLLAALLASERLAAAPAGTVCAATPEAVWALTGKAANARDLDAVLAGMTPEARGRATVEVVGAMVQHLRDITLPARIAAGQARLARDPEAQRSTQAALDEVEARARGLERELDDLLGRHRLPTVAAMGSPRIGWLETPDLAASYAAIDHAPFVRAAWAFAERLETVTQQEVWRLDASDPEAALAVGPGSLRYLVDLEVLGETATGRSIATRIRFRRVGGCWFLDGYQMMKS